MIVTDITERPYIGRARISEDGQKVVIRIPAKKNLMILLSVGGWLFSCIMMLLMTSTHDIEKGLETPVYILYMVIFIPTVFAIKILLWLIKGNEMVEFSNGVLRLSKPITWFNKPKTYLLNECTNFNVRNTENTAALAEDGSFKVFSAGGTGTIAFYYGMKTIKFADGIDEAEGKFILSLLKNKGVLRDEN